MTLHDLRPWNANDANGRISLALPARAGVRMKLEEIRDIRSFAKFALRTVTYFVTTTLYRTLIIFYVNAQTDGAAVELPPNFGGHPSALAR
jgi:hypothetical protein